MNNAPISYTMCVRRATIIGGGGDDCVDRTLWGKGRDTEDESKWRGVFCGMVSSGNLIMVVRDDGVGRLSQYWFRVSI